MDLRYTPDEDAFRAEARAWLEANVPAEPLPSFDTEAGFALHREWERTLWEGRWSAVSWPEEYGGRGADYLHWLIFEEEYYRAGAPGRVNQNGIFLLGPTIMEVGTDEQKMRFLPTMASSEIVWAQAWSEPNAGSDLAAIRSTGMLSDNGRDWVTSGVGRLVLRDLPHRPGSRAPPRSHVRAGAARLGGCHRPPDRAARR
jgi:alkylation response protein AidB-like acyl-CoA dehydrogenase